MTADERLIKRLQQQVGVLLTQREAANVQVDLANEEITQLRLQVGVLQDALDGMRATDDGAAS